jgi:branched-chain amino acid transport system substrate-binding protein
VKRLSVFFLSATIVTGLSVVAGRGAKQTSAPGITDTEIKISQTMPHSGPISGYGTLGKAELAYFRMISDNGGVNGRKINLISRDDSNSPPKTVEQEGDRSDGANIYGYLIAQTLM